MSNTIPPATMVSRKPHVVDSVLDDEMLALDPRSGEVFVFRLTARAIWELLETPMSMKELCDRLREKFDVDEGRCAEEVSMFLGRLHAEGIIQL